MSNKLTEEIFELEEKLKTIKNNKDKFDSLEEYYKAVERVKKEISFKKSLDKTYTCNEEYPSCF